MDFKRKLAAAWSKNNSLLCVGLDPDLEKLPKHLLDDPAPYFAFNKAIIDATADLVTLLAHTFARNTLTSR
jgi:orotidine-5'-phosphate decarboxylase